MQKWLYKILLSIAVITVIGHNTLPHLHDDHEQTLAIHKHEMEQKSHNVFSFAQLDDDFVPAKFQQENIALPIVYLLTPFIDYQLKLLKGKSKDHFGYYREYPPPDIFLSDLPLRAPPVVAA
jgi:hypothetical protein